VYIFMSNFTIGVFDSGMGGLTAVTALSGLLPHADIVYFGDTGHMPYGGRSREQLLYMARKNIAFLEAQGAGLILAACGTVTSVALDTVSKETKTPLLGVAQPAAETAKKLTENGVVGFIATQACVDSGFNQALLERAIPGVRVIARACPRFVPLIESGVCTGSSHELRSAIEEYLRDIKAAGADTVILGCTHYPLIAGAIQEYLGENVKLISSSGEAARALAEKLSGRQPEDGTRGRHIYYTSGDGTQFAALAETLLARPLDGPVIQLEPYPLI
jgi:glutamate racemase